MRTILFAVSVFALVGCGSSSSQGTSGSTSSASSSADPTSLCSTLCTRTAACDSSVDVDACTKKCASAGGGISLYRSDMIDAIASCFQAADCKQVLSDDGLGSCVDDAAVSVAPTDSTHAFCDAFQSAASKCDSPIDHAKCLELAKVYSDDTLQSASHCFEKSCSAMSSCLDAELGN